MLPTFFRAGLIILAAGSALVGVWALFAPQSFFDDFPGGGSAWVSAQPPYNEHLVRDVGALNLALAALLGWAAVALERRLVQVALIVALVYAFPHFVFHVSHLEDLSTGDKVAQTSVLALGVLLPVALLVPARRLLH
jgi:hypothetical protein